jgi:hypothetical protein
MPARANLSIRPAGPALGCREMEITSARDRPAAHALYSALGYTDACARSAGFMEDLDAPWPQ